MDRDRWMALDDWLAQAHDVIALVEETNASVRNLLDEGGVIQI